MRKTAGVCRLAIDLGFFGIAIYKKGRSGCKCVSFFASFNVARWVITLCLCSVVATAKTRVCHERQLLRVNF